MLYLSSKDYIVERDPSQDQLILTVPFRPRCSLCNRLMCHHENCIRTYKELAVTSCEILSKSISIPRFYCPQCHKDHRVLPTFLLPNVRFSIPTIEKILEDPFGKIFDSKLHIQYRNWFLTLVGALPLPETWHLSTRIWLKEKIRLVQLRVGNQTGWLLLYIDFLRSRR